MNRPGLLHSILLLVTMLALSPDLLAHKASDSFIYLDMDQSQVRIDLAIRDLALVLPLDRNGDRQLKGQEIRGARSEITGYVEQGIQLATREGACRLRGKRWGLSRHSDGPYVAGLYQVKCPAGGLPETLGYNLLFEQDALHRALVSVTSEGGETLMVLGPDAPMIPLAETATGWAGEAVLFGTFLYEGVVHLLNGLDHILFLLVLILPSTLASPSGSQEKEHGSLKRRLLKLAGIVSAFTIAHSITLVLAAMDIVRPPIQWVETIIALSIALAALNAVWPILGRKTWKLAFGFGLVHGFGFASVLGDLTNGLTNTVVALAGFNIGVELGQLALLVAAFPLLYLCRDRRYYSTVAVPVTLLAVGIISLYWVADRIPVV